MLMAKIRKQDGNARFFEFLIDSGADYTLISRYSAQLLGIHYKDIQAEETQVEVANLALIHTKKVQLILTIESHDINIPVLIANENVSPILGRKGIFENFDVLFQERDKQVVFY